MNRLIRLLSVLCAVAVGQLVPCGRACALATEQFGNAPIPPNFLNLPPATLDLGNLGSRVYWREVNGDPTFFYRGNTDDLNEALRKFAATEGEVKEVYFLAGPGEAHSLGGDRRFPCDWFAHPLARDALRAPVVKGLFPDASLTVYVPAARPVPADEKVVRRWVVNLSSDTFSVRERATRELATLGLSAAGPLRRALATEESAEARLRIRKLLSRVSGINLDLVQVPLGLKVLEVKDLVERYREGLKHRDPVVRGICAGALAEQSADPVPVLVRVLEKGEHEYVRRCAAGALQRLGQQAVAALPVLKAGLKDPDVNVRNAFEQAVQGIEAAKDDPERPGRLKRHKVIEEDVGRFCKELATRGKKSR